MWKDDLLKKYPSGFLRRDFSALSLQDSNQWYPVKLVHTMVLLIGWFLTGFTYVWVLVCYVKRNWEILQNNINGRRSNNADINKPNELCDPVFYTKTLSAKPFVMTNRNMQVSLYFTDTNLKPFRLINRGSHYVMSVPLGQSIHTSANRRVAKTTAHTPCHPRPPGGGLQRTKDINACISIQCTQNTHIQYTHTLMHNTPNHTPLLIYFTPHYTCPHVCITKTNQREYMCRESCESPRHTQLRPWGIKTATGTWI